MGLGDLVVLIFASFWIWALVGGLFVLWVIDGRIKKEQVLHAIVAMVISWALTEIIKSIFPTERPYIIDDLVPLTATIPSSGAFPSSHTALAFAIGVTIWLHDKKWGTFFVVSALMIGAARVVSNVHFPIDILGGAIVGTLVAFATERVHLFRAIPPLWKH